MKMNEQGPQNDAWMQKRKNELFDEARNAADRRDLPSLANAHQKLTSFYALLKQLEAIQPESLSGNSASNPTPKEILPVETQRIGESDKERGERIRTEWVSTHPCGLTPIRGALFRKANGDKLGIAYGDEKKGRENRWFLGLPWPNKFECAVLLCRTLDGNIFWVTLPKDFIANHKDHFSKSEVGPQVKFSLLKQGQNYYLRVPGSGNVPVTEYLNTIP